MISDLPWQLRNLAGQLERGELLLVETEMSNGMWLYHRQCESSQRAIPDGKTRVSLTVINPELEQAASVALVNAQRTKHLSI